MANYWLKEDFAPLNVCFGSGRFLRSVLVPALQECPPVIVQTRGRSFLDHCRVDHGKNGLYEVDTVQYNGSIQTDSFRVSGVFSLGVDADAVWNILVPACGRSLRIVGVGVTEQGLANAETTAMRDLYRFFQELAKCQGDRPSTLSSPARPKLCVINTDNVPWNGQVLQSHMTTLATNDPVTRTFLTDHVVFLNSMVDRITSHRPDNPDVPRAEPVPTKALVVLDGTAALPPYFQNGPGVVQRTTERQFTTDIALKLRIANGTHTALAHVMALCGMARTDSLLNNALLLSYLDAFVNNQVIAALADEPTKKEAMAVWEDWRARLNHAHFGLSTFFITQNGAAKGGIRFGPTVLDLIRNGNPPITQSTVFAYAALLRWLTCCSRSSERGGVYRGKLCRSDASIADTVTYADGLRYNLAEGWYEFCCACCVDGKSITEWFDDDAGNGSPRQPEAYQATIRKYLLAPGGGDLGAAEQFSAALDQLVGAIAVLYARMIAGDDPLAILEELHTTGALDKACMRESSMPKHGGPLHFNPRGLDLIPDHCSLMKLPLTVEWLNDVVAHEVASLAVIDLHTHLLPPSHGPLCLWGIDELLTYHYLVAEFFMTAPPEISPEVFFGKTKQDQADLIWKSLFLDRTPLSEATRGVVTTLTALGLVDEVKARDLGAIREYYRRWRVLEDGASRFSSMVHELSGVRYNVMTNIPFDPNEAQHWHQKKPLSEHYRTALRVDPFLSGDWAAVQTALRVSGYDDSSFESARQFLRDWIDILRPEYVMASTPHDFGNTNVARRISVNLEAMRVPGAFAEALTGMDGCNDDKVDTPTQVDETSDLLCEVLVKVCEERGLPIALKIGAHRQVNPRLRQAGDGLVAFADAGMLGRLCATYPKIRFLATFLSRNNQQEACVLASKFNNLHIYGCWWYCFTPSMVREITQMRIELLGTAFTAQHSDARVVDQLIYKWAHSRSVIASVLVDEVAKLCQSGWSPCRAEVRRDVRRLLGGSYETFLVADRPSAP